MDELNGFLEWVWARHHNILSWYVRPHFVIPFCYFAYKRQPWGILLTLLLFPTSLFWFPAPANPSPEVIAYLAWERDFLTQGDPAAQIGLVVLVIAFFIALGAAFWNRSGRYGLLVLVVASFLKVGWSVAFGGASGWAAVAPALFSLVVSGIGMYFITRKEHRNPHATLNQSTPS